MPPGTFASSTITERTTCGRLAGTVLSGVVYQLGLKQSTNGGLIWCLLTSTAFVLAAGLLSLRLPRPKHVPVGAMADAGD